MATRNIAQHYADLQNAQVMRDWFDAYGTIEGAKFSPGGTYGSGDDVLRLWKDFGIDTSKNGAWR